MRSEPIIKAENVSKFYSDVCALNNFSSEFYKGINGLIGPNGAGKSTFLNILQGLLAFDSGYIEIFGNISQESNLITENYFGVLPEDTNYPLTMSVERYIHYISNIRGENANDSIKLLKNLSVPVNRCIGGLSSGMYQKFGVVIALIGKPRLVILDEPTANLDPISRRNILDLIVENNKEYDISFLISSHILTELESIAHKLTIINNGKMIAQDKAIKLRKKWQKTNEITLTLTNCEKFYSFIQNNPKYDNIDYFGDRIKICINSNENYRLELENLINTIHKLEIDIIELNNSCTLDDVYMRLFDNEEI